MIKSLKFLALPIVFLIFGCDTDCDDCGPTKWVSYEIANELNSSLEFHFYKKTSNGSLGLDPITIPFNESVVIHAVSNTTQDPIALTVTKPTSKESFDSLVVYKSGLYSQTFYPEECEEFNPFCEENYMLTEEKNSKNGNEFKKYLLIYSE